MYYILMYSALSGPRELKPAACICGCRLSHTLHTAYRDNRRNIIQTISDFVKLWVTHINHSVNFTAMLERETRELEPTIGNCPQRVNWPIRIVYKGQLSIKLPPTFTPPPVRPELGDYPPLPPTHIRWVSSQTVLERPLLKTDIDVPSCPWNLVTMAFRA